MLLAVSKTPATGHAGSQSAPLVWVVCRRLGEASEVWLTRQITGIKRLRPHVLCWEASHNSAALNGTPLCVLPFASNPADGRGRWLLRLRNLRHGNFYAAAGAEAAHINRLMRADPPGAVLCQFGHTALRILPIARRMGIPVVAHFHALDVTSALRNRWYRSSLLRNLQRFAAIVVVADYQRDWMLQQGVAADRVHVIPCGVPTAEFLPGEPAADSVCKFLAVGRFVEKKAPLATIRAFAICLQSGSRADLTMIGDGPLLEEARLLVRMLGIQRHVHLSGARPSDEVLAAMQRADAFVQHSVTAANGDKEGWPVSIAEACACGLPVVATRHAGIVSQVIEGESGFLVDEHDVEGMARQMALLAGDADLRRRMGAAGRQRMAELFDSGDQISRLEDVLLSVAGASWA